MNESWQHQIKRSIVFNQNKQTTKLHTLSHYKYEVLYCLVTTNSHHSSCHSVPNAHCYTWHIRTPSSLLRQTNRHHSTALRDSNISIRVYTGSSKAAFSAAPSHTVCFPWQVRLWLSAAMFMFIKGNDGGLEAFKTLWGLCFCCFEGRKKKQSGVCCSHFLLLYQEPTSYLGVAACLVNGGTRKGEVVDCSCRLESRCAWRSLFSKRPVGSVQFTQQVFDKGTLVSPTHPTHTDRQTARPSCIAVHNTTKEDIPD